MERKKLVIAFDVDDVLNTFTEEILKKCVEKFGHPFPWEEVVWGFENYKPEETEYVHGLFRDAEFIDSVPFLDGVVGMLEELTVNRGHDVVFPTSTYSAVMSVRALRLYEHIPFIHPRNYILTGRKDLLRTDLQFDDCLSHIKSSRSGIPVLVNKPWNLNEVGYVRANSSIKDYMKIIDMAEQGYTKQDIYKEMNPTAETKGPHIIVVVGGSGMGKSTIVTEICKDSSAEKVVSCTTRKPREGEQEGKEYFYRSEEEFKKMIDDGSMLEYTTYAGNLYGTPKMAVDSVLAKGKNAVIIMDVEGVKHMREAFPDKTYSVQIVRNKEDLIASILARNVPMDEKIRRIAQLEGEDNDAKEICDYRILNTVVTDAANEIINIFKE